MISLLRRWFGLKCVLRSCGGTIGHFENDEVCWRCASCGKVVK